jgi:drug/metabolite transporter (DMT)-like permease
MNQMWIILSLISAFSLATADAFTKIALHNSDDYLVAMFRLLFSLPLLVIVLIFIPFPTVDSIFFTAISLSLPLEIFAFVFYIKALKLSPMSLTLPFLSLTPVFLIFVSFFILGEVVSIQGGIGIIFIAAGSYVLNLHEVKKGILMPFKAIFKEKGCVFIIITAIIYSITSALGKLAIQHSSALFFGSVYFILFTAVFSFLVLVIKRKEIKEFVLQKNYKALIFPGICQSFMVISHMIAISIAKVAYMISLKRTSLLIGVIYGYFLFKEKHIKERLSGALLMFAGFVLIVTAK